MARGDKAAEFAESLGGREDPVTGRVQIDATSEAVAEEAERFIEQARAQGCTCSDPEVTLVMIRPGEASMLLSHDDDCPLMLLLGADDSNPV